ncbi:MAG TPA: amidohydrolase family protein [Acidimicrobiales bacterium]|nr:amidohydrolase family protein [Acidimicrobiales bacterium]
MLDARGLWVVPGLVDLQCNGGWGIDLATEPERLWELAALLPRTGVTAWLPTIVTGPPALRRRALAALAAGPPPELAGTPLATPLGLHLEGPFLAPERRGAHPPAWLRPVSPDGPRVVEEEGWSRADGVALVTLAPECPGGLDLVRTLVDRGVVVSAGHSSATAAEAEAAIDAGVRWVTHLFNAMAPLHHRDPGLVGVALADDRLHVGLIADGLHVDPRVVRTAARALGDRLTLVTDAVAALGLPRGPVTLGATPATSGPDGVRLPDGTLAGSTLALDQAIRNLVSYGIVPSGHPGGSTGVPPRGGPVDGEAATGVPRGGRPVDGEAATRVPAGGGSLDPTAGTGVPPSGGPADPTAAALDATALAAAVRAASTAPARLLGAADRGTLATGAAADLVLLDGAGEVVATVVGGRVAYDRRRLPARTAARGRSGAIRGVGTMAGHARSHRRPLPPARRLPGA